MRKQRERSLISKDEPGFSGSTGHSSRFQESRISLFTGKIGDPQRINAVRSALIAAVNHRSDLMALPGYSLGKGIEDADQVQHLADEHGIAIIAEADHTYLFAPNKNPVGPYVQLFHTGSTADHDAVHSLVAEFNSGKRIIKHRGLRIGILLCGENDILRNDRKRGLWAVPRHGVHWPFEYDVLVNPAHTSMGQWNLLHKRFEYFSKPNK